MIFENALQGVFLISLTMSFVTSIFYKVFMDHDELKKIKDKMNDLQEKAKNARKEGKEDEAMEYTQESMQYTTDQMKMQFKPMIATFVVIIPLFWFVFPNLYPAANVNMNENDTLNYRGVEKSISLESTEPLEIRVGDGSYSKGEVVRLNDYTLEVEKYKEEEGKLKLSRVAAQLPISLPYVGNTLGWLGWYIIVTLGFSQVLRKLMGARP